MPKLLIPAAMIGRQVGKLKIVECLEPSRGILNRGGVYRCQCECGKVKNVNGYRFNSFSSAPHSCGCSTKRDIGEKSAMKRTYQDCTINHEYAAHKCRAVNKKQVYLDKDNWKKIVFRPCSYCGGIDTRSCMNREIADRLKLQYAEFSDAEIAKYRVNINGIDRIDSSRGYEPDNCLPACGMCNTMKLDYSLDEFIVKIRKVCEHTKDHVIALDLTDPVQPKGV